LLPSTLENQLTPPSSSASTLGTGTTYIILLMQCLKGKEKELLPTYIILQCSKLHVEGQHCLWTTIVFGQPFNQRRYDEVIEACALLVCIRWFSGASIIKISWH
jgi:hypothetical protein